jgi:predicted MPP superfamily phosphohydrolase
VYATLVEPRWLALERVTIPVAGLPSQAEDLQMVLLSDFHLGPDVDQEHVARAVRLALQVAPDLILIAGDFVSRAQAIPACAEEVSRLRAPGGVFACLGNHDHWTAPDQVAAAMTGAGVAVLRNRAVELLDGLWLAGVDDVWEQRADLDAALSDVPSHAQVTLLAHEPEFADAVAADGRVALQLSGHTHGGQVCLPLLGPPILPYLGRRYPAGHYHVGRLQLYVTRGVGLISPPVRFNCRPEVTLIELRAVRTMDT